MSQVTPKISRSRLDLRLTLVVMTLTLQFLMSPVGGVFDDGLEQDDNYTPGDIVLGALVRIRWRDDGVQCGPRLARPGIQVAAAMKYAVDKINRNSSILQGFTLGTAILNDCSRPSVALARAAKFAPLKPCVGCNEKKQCPAGSISTPSSYKVVGVMGPFSSPMATAVASFLGLYKIPIMSWSATSPELSGEKYKYFARTVPSDEQLVEAIVALLEDFKWTYVSLLNTQGSRESVVLFRRFTRQKGICIAMERVLSADDSEQDYDDLIKTLAGSAKARKPTVIVVLLDGDTTDSLLAAMERNNATHKFIFIGNDGFQPKLAKKVKGLLPIKFINFDFRTRDPEFEEYYENKSPWRDEDEDPWEGEYTKEESNCTADSGGLDGTIDCDKFKTLADLGDFQLFDGIARVTAIVQTYARALDKLIEEHCPKMRQATQEKKRAGLIECIKGDLLFEYMTNTTFMHYDWLVEFDNKGDIYGDYIAKLSWGKNEEEYTEMLAKRSMDQSENGIRLYTEPKNGTEENKNKYHEVDFGNWRRKDQSLTIDWDILPWSPVDWDLLPWSPNSTNYSITKPLPKSICSDPCRPGERMERLDMSCCWECKECRKNEKLIKNQTKCEACNRTYWPTKDFADCEAIEPTYMPYSALEISISLIILALLGLASVGVITGLFIKHWERRVVKGCTREMMVPIVIGLILSYLTVISLLIPPNVPVCYLSLIGFHISLCLLFGPLFLKTHRVHMIFRASDRCKTRVKLADSKALLMWLFLVIAVLVALMVLVICVAKFEAPIEVKLIQHSDQVRHVQKCCNLQVWVVLVPLGYNFILLILCAIYGFLTRKLPENYNESWYIFIAVIVTIFVWITCIPLYLVAEQAHYKIVLISIALIVNGLVISGVLFVPKIYAVYNVPERDIRISRLGSRRLSLAVGENETMNNRSR